MKNIIKLFGIIALAAVIGFSMTACDNNATLSDNNSGTKSPPPLPYLFDIEDLAIARGNGEVKLYWTDPKNEDFDHVEITRSDGTTRTVTRGTSEYTWDELTNDTDYTFKVKAVNSNGGKSAGVAITGTPVSNSTATPQSEKELYETAVDVVALNASVGSNYRARVIKLKPGQVADTSVTVTIADAGVYFDNPNGRTLILKSVPASAEANDEVIVEFSKGGVKVTHTIEVTIYKSSELSAAQTFLPYGYDVINSAYINRDDVKVAAPIINLSKANKAGLIIQSNVSKSIFEMETANSISELYNKLSVWANVQGSYGLFSAKANTEFSVENGGKKTNFFSKGRSIQQTKDEWLRNSDPAFLKIFFTDEFIHDINSLTDNRTVEQFIKKYGTHLIKRVYWGGTAEFNYSYSGTELKTENDIRAAVAASYGVAKGGVNVANKNKADELKENSKFYAKTVGGKNTSIMNVDDFTANYPDWVDSVASNPDICAIGNFRDCFLPLWELVEQVDPAKAQAVEDEFYKQLAERGSVLASMIYKKYVETEPFIYGLSVGETIPPGYVFVKNGPTGNGSDLDANSQVGNDSKVVRIGYLCKVEPNNHFAIAEIKVVDGRTSAADNLPAGYRYDEGWRAVYSDLNLGNSGIFRYIIYRLVNENDKYAIDKVGAYDNVNPNDGHDLAGTVGWDWVRWHNSDSWADLNRSVGGNYVYLTVHKSPFTWTVDR